MKSLCVTGILQQDLDAVGSALQRAGMRVAVPASRAESLDIAYWHQQVLAISRQETGQVLPIKHPGRLWEQLAGDIFLANLQTELWGWTDTRSIWLLDFWAALEPRIDFILVAASLEHMLIRLIEDGDAVGDTDHLVADWQLSHREMLRFYHRHADRCLLLDADDVAANPAEFVRRCNAQRNMSLNAAAAFFIPPAGSPPLARHLAQEICRSHQAAMALQSELTATIVPLGKAAATTGRIETPDLIADYRKIRERSAEADKVAELQWSLAEAERENEILASELDRAKTDAGERVSVNEVAAVRDQLAQAEQEYEFVLLQLHQAQEELEQYFLREQETERVIRNADARWQRMIQRNPDFIDHAAISVALAGQGFRWRIEDLGLRGRNLPVVEVDMIVEPTRFGLRFERKSNPLVRWPATAGSGPWLDIVVSGDQEADAERLEIVPDLAATDWDLLKTLVRLLARILSEPDRLPGARELPLEAMAKGLGQLDLALRQMARTIRYDGVALKHEQVNPDYEHLWLRFTNLVFGDLHWPEFEFRASCANVRPGHFGSHPKLEFPTGPGQAPFEAWFAESRDDHGAKLELRFALPEGMDIGVWNRISERDRSFIRSLAQRLPSIIATLEGDGVRLKRSWQEWSSMVKDIRRILDQHGA